jgi:hypothetical protein
MPTDTTFLKLKTYNNTSDTSASFLNFRDDIMGTSASSNMGKIDTFFQGLSGSLVTNKGNLIFPVHGILSSGGNYKATNPLITDYVEGMVIGLYLNIKNPNYTSLEIYYDDLQPSLGIIYLKKIDDYGVAQFLDAGDLQKDKRYLFTYNTGAWILTGTLPLDQIIIDGSGSANEIIVSTGSSLKLSGVLIDSVAKSSGSFIVATLNPSMSNEWVLSNGSATSIRFESSACSVLVDVLSYIPLLTNASCVSLKYNNSLTVESGSLTLPSGLVTAGSYNRVEVNKYGMVISGSNTPNIYYDIITTGSVGEIIIAGGVELVLSNLLLTYPSDKDNIMVSTGSAWRSSSSLNLINVLNTGSGIDATPENIVGLYAREGAEFDEYTGFLYSKNSSGSESGPFTSEGVLPKFDDSLIGSSGSLAEWTKFKQILTSSRDSGKLFSSTIIVTYSVLSTGYIGGVLGLNGDIHFVPSIASKGMKLSLNGTVSTYNLVYSAGGYYGGVLDTNGYIHFIPNSTNAVGQKISPSGVVSTYTLPFKAVSYGYQGGVLAPNGDVHFVPSDTGSIAGQKISVAGVISTYNLIYTPGGYFGGMLAPNGDIHFIPINAPVGQKVSPAGVVSTYNLVYTGIGLYHGGVLSPNGDIHFVPSKAIVGQKIDINGIVSTYDLVYTVDNGYIGGVLAPDGYIHFVPYAAAVGQMISPAGVVSTYTLAYSTTLGYWGGILSPIGEIHFIGGNTLPGQKIITMAGKPFSLATCLSPYLNKL